jgi:hypothetical protein
MNRMAWRSSIVCASVNGEVIGEEETIGFDLIDIDIEMLYMSNSGK